MRPLRLIHIGLELLGMLGVYLMFMGCRSTTSSNGDDVTWEHYEQPDSIFSVDLPGHRVDSDRKGLMLAGDYSMHFVGVRSDDGDFEIGYSNVRQYLKQLSKKQVFESVRDDIGAVFGANNFEAHSCSSGAYEGMEYRLDLHQGQYPEGSVGDFRVFVANNYVYEQVAIGKSELVKGPMRDRFFSSLHLKDSSIPKSAGGTVTAPVK